MDEIVLLRIGRVIKTHGVVGSILVAPDSEEPERLLALKSVSIGNSPSTSMKYSITSLKLHRVKKHTGIVMTLRNLSTMEVAQTLIGQNVYAPETDLPQLEDESYFLDDLPGLEVRLENGRHVGHIREWRDYPSQIMLVIETESGESLVPLVIPQIVSDVDIDGGVVTLQEWEGLLDD